MFLSLKKLKPDTETDGKEKVLEGRGDRLERQMDRPSTEASGSAMAPTLAPGPSYASGSSGTTVINSSDLTDSREINFEYLKHVVLKFMSCREAEVRLMISVCYHRNSSWISAERLCPFCASISVFFCLCFFIVIFFLLSQ